MSIRVAMGQVPRLSQEFMLFARQLGVTSVQVNTPDLPGEQRWELEDLSQLRKTCDDAGVVLEAIENLPPRFYIRAMLGEDGRDEEIENVKATVRNIAYAGIPVLGYHWMPMGVWRTAVEPVGRAGAIATTFDQAVLEDARRREEIYVAARESHLEDTWVRGMTPASRHMSRDAMWSNYRYFMDRVLPVAEEVGVRLALHPDDPPVDVLNGVARIFSSVDGLVRAAGYYRSRSWGVELCLGTISEMGGREDVLRAIRILGDLGKIVYVHLRDVRGTVPRFSECFLGEGNYDPLEVLQALEAVGFDGFVLDDHVPCISGDSAYGHRARAFTVGYIQGLLRGGGKVDR